MIIVTLGLAVAAIVGAVGVIVRLAVELRRRRRGGPRTASVASLVLGGAFTTVVSVASVVFAGTVGIFVAFCDYGGSCVDDYLQPIAGVVALAAVGDIAAIVGRRKGAVALSASAALAICVYVARIFLWHS